MNLKRFLLAAGSALLGLTAAASAQSIDRAVFSIGTTTTNAQGARWAYLLWQPTEHNALAGHKIAIYGKDGPADSANSFQRRAVTQRQTDPLVIQSLLTRAANLGDDLALLDTRINAMFAAAMPNTNLSLAQKISAVIRGAQNDPKLLGNIVFLGRVHPSLNMCLGHAWAEPLTGAGKATFEIRDFDVAANKDLGVFGRVTVDPLNPIVLPSPGMPVQFKEASPVDDLNIRLRWATPNPLREVGLLQHGFNLFRMNKAFALANNYHINPPTPTQLRGLLAVAGDNVRQINETPIIVNRIHDAASAANFVVDPTYYIADDNGRYRFGGTNFVNGAEYYYFVSARDLLGRDGFLSSGGLAIACDRIPPDAPKGISVENFYSFDPGSQTTKQLLQVKWPQVPNTGDVVTAFYVYRWTNAVDATKVGQTNPVLNRIAGPINYQPGQAFLTYIDNGAGSPQAPADYGKTFWYTVRAADAGACSNNLSANSSPVFGVLRDRTAPGAPTGDIGILCCQPGGRTDKDFLVTDSTQVDTNFAYYRFTVQRTNQALAFADFYYHNGAETNVIAHVPFPAGTGPLVYDWQFNRGLALGSTHRIFCKVVAKDGKESALILGSNDPLPPVGSRLSANWDAWLDCRRIRLVDSATGGRNECGPHTPINPDDGVSIEPPDIFFTPPATSKEFRLYRRVDGGPMTLIKQGPVTNDPPTEMQLQDPHPPANSAIVCYYVQCLDEHGNAGPLTQIADCFKFKLPSPKPLLSPLVAEGTESDPLMVVNWFCPPFGVERFELYIAMADGSEVPFNPIVSTNLTASSLAQPITKWVKLGDNWWPKKFYVYRTPRVGPQFGDGALFQVKVKAELNRKYIVFVKPVGLDGEPDPDSQNSKSEQFLWSAPKQVGPMVPWPERPLPNVATNSYPDYVGPIFINNTNATTNFVGVGLIIGATDKPSHRREGSTPARIAGNQDPMTYLATSQGGDEMMPIVVYRFQETNAYFPKVSGDIVQVSPMMERIAYSTVNDAQFGVNAFIYDPFIDVLSASQLDVPGTPAGAARNFIVLYDTQPVVLGSRYRYLIVRFGPNREIVEVIPTKTVEVL